MLNSKGSVKDALLDWGRRTDEPDVKADSARKYNLLGLVLQDLVDQK